MSKRRKVIIGHNITHKCPFVLNSMVLIVMILVVQDHYIFPNNRCVIYFEINCKHGGSVPFLSTTNHLILFYKPIHPVDLVTLTVYKCVDFIVAISIFWPGYDANMMSDFQGISHRLAISRQNWPFGLAIWFILHTKFMQILRGDGSI